MEKEKLLSDKNLIMHQKSGNYEDGSGELEIKPSFGIGKAPRDARPTNKLEISANNIGQASDNEEEKNERTAKEVEEKTIDQNIEGNNIPDKNTAFSLYKIESNSAQEIESSIVQNSEELKKRKFEARELLDNCNTYKNQIEQIKISLNDKKINKLNLGVSFFFIFL